VPAFAQALRASGFDPSTLVVGPDAESQSWVRALADQLGLAFAVARKTRHGDRSVAVDFASTVSPAGRPVLLLDDIVSSGATLITCAAALKTAGAQGIDVIITHALYPPEMANHVRRHRDSLRPLELQRAASDQCDPPRRPVRGGAAA
jgi:ribose-phosphate pyrophosphokinase